MGFDDWISPAISRQGAGNQASKAPKDTVLIAPLVAMISASYQVILLQASPKSSYLIPGNSAYNSKDEDLYPKC